MRMKWLVVLSVTSAAPAAAQAPRESPNFSAMSDAELIERVQATHTEGLVEACDIKVPLLTELVRRNRGNERYKVVRLMAEVFCAAEEDRHADGLRLVKQMDGKYPEQPMHLLGLYFATQLDDGSEALARLRALAKSGELNELSDHLVYSGMRTIRAGGLHEELDEFSYELTTSAEFRELDRNLQASFASNAIRRAVKTGDLSRVDDLLDGVPNPSTYLTMLSDLDYEAAWPKIGERAGDNLGRVAETYVRQTAERLAAEPEDRDRLSDYAHALYFAGRYQEAIDVTRNWRPERDSLEGVAEGDAWSLNIESYALDALGRRAEADAVFDQLATLPADEFPWVVNFVINRASRLVGQERWEEGLVATGLARSVAEDHGTTYAKMLIARDRTCALQHLARSEEANREVEFLVEQFDQSPPIAITGLMCVGRHADAETLIARVMGEKAARDRLLSELQDSRFELFYTPTTLPQARDVVLANAALREQALKHVRLLPERFVPVSYLRRVEVVQSAQ